MSPFCCCCSPSSSYPVETEQLIKPAAQQTPTKPVRQSIQPRAVTHQTATTQDETAAQIVFKTYVATTVAGNIIASALGNGHHSSTSTDTSSTSSSD